jgi:predicted PurR-regulated permease PerM
VRPVQRYVEERLPRFRRAAVPLTAGLVVAVLGAGAWAVAESVDEAVEAAPEYAGRAEALWTSATTAATQLGIPLPPDLASSTEARQRLAAWLTPVARGVWAALTGFVLVFFLFLLMLLEASSWSATLRDLWHDGRGHAVVETIADVGSKLRQYLYLRTILGLMSAAAAAVWLLILGVDLIVVWVTLTFLLNYIPNLGSIVAVFPPVLMAGLQHGWVHATVTLAGLTVIEQIIGNYLDPRMAGRRLQLSAVVVLVALVFWSWLWGAAGALLAVPMTVLLLAFAARIPALRPLAALVGLDGEPHAGGRPRGRAA